MFFKAISLLMAAIVAYVAADNNLDNEQAVFFVMLPAAAVMGYLLLGVAD